VRTPGEHRTLPPRRTPIERVVLRIEPDDDCCDTVWTSLTADEALTLAHALIEQAEAAR
jgi:hypothetical protein